ncbi:hypothetical protein K7X08_037219 [Anisodus acutangulus]|uniref:Uncharacterized protein n=1 Tax=Anisodus acutangulus TaxID=402998 RepID=A0A9Q1M0T7_9SOLA|nr:hypothetical protein K7X08_037219 [Anisodus acutangulus]
MTTGRINQVASLADADARTRPRPAQTGAEGSDASARPSFSRSVVRPSGQIGGRDPVPAAFTESESPNRHTRTTPSHGGATKAWDARTTYGSARARSARAERRPFVRRNAIRYAAQETHFERARPALAPRLKWHAGQEGRCTSRDPT